MDDENELLDPPRYDMLTVKFQGDLYDMVLPYCEVANGDITSIDEQNSKISILVSPADNSSVSFSLTDFATLIEKTFDTKEITKLQLQLAGSFEVYDIL